MKAAAYHRTENCPQPIYGCQLETGDTLEATDVYDSTSGQWSPCPMPGATLGPGVSTYWVRPIEGGAA